jgi:hypothetical protein
MKPFADLRPLPRSLAPLADESLPGFLLRLAHRLDARPSVVVRRIGLVPATGHAHTGRLAAQNLLRIQPQAAMNVARTTRLTPQEVAGLTLTAYARTYKPVELSLTTAAAGGSPVIRQPWILQSWSRFCPACLAGDASAIQRAHGGAWRLAWRLPVVFACPIHQRLLADSCPVCGSKPFLGNGDRARLLPNLDSEAVHPTRCRSRPPAGGRALCGFNLAEAQPGEPDLLKYDDGAALSALQHRILEQLTAAPETSRGTAAPSYFQDLFVAASLLKLSWPAGSAYAGHGGARFISDHVDDRHRAIQATAGSGRWVRFWTPPDSAATCAALLLAADRLLGDDARPGARDRIAPLGEACYRRHPRAYAAMRKAPMSQELARSLVRRRHGFNAAGRTEISQMRVAQRKCGYGPHHVPAYLTQPWAAVYLAEFGGAHARALRRLAALKLVELTAGGSYVDAASVLGIPIGHAQSAMKKAVRWFSTGSNRAKFDAAIESIAGELELAAHRIDYARRRAALKEWRLPYDDWCRLIDDLRYTRHGRLARWTEDRRLLASTLIWTRITQGEHTLAPPILDRKRIGGDGDLVTDLALFLTPRHQRGLRLELRRRFDHYAGDFAARLDGQG